MEEKVEDDGASAATTQPGPEPMRYVPAPQEQRSSALYNAVQSFGQAGAGSVDELIERAEELVSYIENGRAA